MSICFNDHQRFKKISLALLQGQEISKEDQDYGLLYIEDQYWYNTTNKEFHTVMQMLDNLRDKRFTKYYVG